MRTLTGPVVAAAAVGLLSGCSPGFCTQIGAVSGIQVSYADVLRQHPRQVLSVEACVRDACETLETRRRDRFGAMNVGEDEVTGVTPVEVRLSITDGDGNLVFRGSTTVHPEKVQPNGPDCPPTAWVGHVVATGDSELAPRGTGAD